MPKLLFVAAHPDDDTFGIARSVALHSDDPRLRLVVVYATDGEAGEIAPETGVRREDLGQVRRAEAMDSWRAIGRTPDRVEWWGFPDGNVDAHHRELTSRIAGLLTEEEPDVVATFGPDGVTGHPDHVAVSRATTEAFHATRRSGSSGLHRLLYAAIPQSWIDRWNTFRREEGLWEWDPSQPFHLRGVPDETIAVDVDTSAVIARVVAAVRSHRTQWSYSSMDDDRALAESLRRDHFVIAWPPHTAPPLTDVFDGL